MKNNTFAERRKKLQEEISGYEKDLQKDFTQIKNIALISGLVFAGVGIVISLRKPKKTDTDSLGQDQGDGTGKKTSKPSFMGKLWASMQDFLISSAIDMVKNQISEAIVSYNQKDAGKHNSDNTDPEKK